VSGDVIEGKYGELIIYLMSARCFRCGLGAGLSVFIFSACIGDANGLAGQALIQFAQNDLQ